MTETLDRLDPPRAEAPLTLEEPAPRVLGWWDQISLWGNLGITLLGPVTAAFVLAPATGAQMSLVAAGAAVVVGTLIGALLLGAATLPGVVTGAPAMVVLRGLLGRRLSAVPTLVNVVQLIGWTTFEIVVITSAAQQLLPWHGVRWPYVLAAGALTLAMTWRPLGAVRLLRRFALAAVAVVVPYLFVQLLRHPLPSLTRGSWSGFWLGVDLVVGVGVSWTPLAADYTRHSRSGRAAFGGAVIGYSVTQVAAYLLGLVALATVVDAGSADLQHDMFAALIAAPLGRVAFAVLILRELDESFADGYSTVVSLQNLWPRADRRVLAAGVCGAATVAALTLSIASYEDFLLLLASVFVPLTAVLLVSWFTRPRRGLEWDVTAGARSRWLMLVPWLAGFVVYDLVNPGGVSWWARWWTSVDAHLHLTVRPWMSATLLSLAVSAVVTLLVQLPTRTRPRAGAARR